MHRGDGGKAMGGKGIAAYLGRLVAERGLGLLLFLIGSGWIMGARSARVQHRSLRLRTASHVFRHHHVVHLHRHGVPERMGGAGVRRSCRSDSGAHIPRGRNAHQRTAGLFGVQIQSAMEARAFSLVMRSLCPASTLSVDKTMDKSSR